MQRSHRRSVTLVLGGVRSGKSRFALEVAMRAAGVTFVATARSCDDEMRSKIERHRAERPSHWDTKEAPLAIAEAVRGEDDRNQFVVVDCLTLFASNLMEALGGDWSAIAGAVDELCASLRDANRSIVLVSNEVGSGIVPAYAAGRQFRDLLGEINQRVAAVSDQVVLMIAGLPVAIKGNLEDLR
jgi:adenosylcobinamide kinase / adenosylcobinamide-phosphate guanylyltransferase